MKSKLSDLAAIAEIVASIGVILSLVFVGFQLSEGNRETRATTTQLAVKSEMDMTAVFVEHAALWEKISTGAPLAAGEESRRAMLLFNLFMLDSANRYMQFTSGYLEVEAWEGRMQVLPDFVDYPIYPVWRESGAGRNQTADFLQLLDSLAPSE